MLRQKGKNYSLVVPFEASDLTAVPHYRWPAPGPALSLHTVTPYVVSVALVVVSLSSSLSLPIIAYTVGGVALPKRNTFLGRQLYQKVEHWKSPLQKTL